MPYKIEFSPVALEHLNALRKFDQQRVTDSIETQLRYNPSGESRHRKLLRSNLIAARELRLGELRVYYNVHEPEQEALIRANGKPVAVLSSAKGMDAESIALANSPKFAAIIERSRARQTVEGGISIEEVRRRLGLKPLRRGRNRRSQRSN